MPVQIWTSPLTWARDLARIPDDKLDYEIIFAAGNYEWMEGLQRWYYHDGVQAGTIPYLNHARGGIITLRSTSPNAAVIRPPNVSTIYRYQNLTAQGGNTNALFVNAQEIYFDGFKIEGVAAPLTATDSNARYWPEGFNINLGSVHRATPTLATVSPGCDPSYVHVTRLTVEGGGAGIAVVPSRDPDIYTNIRFRNIKWTGNSRNGCMTIYAYGYPTWPDMGGFATVQLDNIRGTTVSGPDGPAWGGPAFGSHNDAGAGLDLGRWLAGRSSITAHNIDWLTTVNGSGNHDMHCFRLFLLTGSQTSALFRDCRFRGQWVSGHAGGDAGGNLWLGYLHSGGPAFYGYDRPRLDFENCLFDGYVAPTVLGAYGQGGEDAPFRYLFQAAAAADYHFWDCLFEWDLPPQLRDDGSYTDVALLAANSNLYFHSCTMLNTRGADPTFIDNAPNRTVTVDTQTRRHVNAASRRRRLHGITTIPDPASPGDPGSDYPVNDLLEGTGSFEDPSWDPHGMWTFTGGATRYATFGPTVDGQRILRMEFNSGAAMDAEATVITRPRCTVGQSVDLYAYVSIDPGITRPLEVYGRDSDLASWALLNTISPAAFGIPFTFIHLGSVSVGAYSTAQFRLRTTHGGTSGSWYLDRIFLSPDLSPAGDFYRNVIDNGSFERPNPTPEGFEWILTGDARIVERPVTLPDGSTWFIDYPANGTRRDDHTHVLELSPGDTASCTFRLSDEQRYYALLLAAIPLKAPGANSANPTYTLTISLASGGLLWSSVQTPGPALLSTSITPTTPWATVAFPQLALPGPFTAADGILTIAYTGPGTVGLHTLLVDDVYFV